MLACSSITNASKLLISDLLTAAMNEASPTRTSLMCRILRSSQGCRIKFIRIKVDNTITANIAISAAVCQDVTRAGTVFRFDVIAPLDLYV